MDNRSFESGAAASPPAAPASPTVGHPTAGDPQAAVPATKPGPYWFYQLGEELRSVLTAAGITPDRTNLTQLLASINLLISSQTAQLHGRNVIVNGCCSVSQLNGSAEITPVGNSYPIDNVQYSLSQASKLKCDQTASLMGALGAVWSLRTTVLAKYTPIATDVLNLHFPIEGLNFARFKYGTANAKAGSLQFKALPSVAGTYSGCIANYAGTRSYPFSFAVTADDIAAGGKLVKIENIPGDTGGAWVGATNAGAAEIRFDLGCGANFKGAAGAWVAGDVRGVTGALAFVDQVNGSTLAITDVQFEVGAFCTQFERKLDDQNLRECQRYLPSFKYQGANTVLCQGMATTTTNIHALMRFYTPTRVPVTGIIVSGLFKFIEANGVDHTGTPVWTGYGAGLTSASLSLPEIGFTVGQTGYFYTNDANAKIHFTGAQI